MPSSWKNAARDAARRCSSAEERRVSPILTATRSGTVAARRSTQSSSVSSFGSRSCIPSSAGTSFRGARRLRRREPAVKVEHAFAPGEERILLLEKRETAHDPSPLKEAEEHVI